MQPFGLAGPNVSFRMKTGPTWSVASRWAFTAQPSPEAFGER